ncbi:DsbA family oxidoreductase [Kribbella sp. NBC_00709]|uniref:DsbA family oxidoreductase n=1 Tax=Kribbella sp. NBC_00709 TaxID=2975972 RepID=UPI002E2D2206|nr:DsbA family oxidoreductase [Kribbella sp. NBC_00709]
MRIDFWSDIICPWCGLMEHRLDEAVERFAHGDEVKVVHRSFPLHPDLPVEGTTQIEMAKQYGLSRDAIARNLLPIEQLAEREGLRPYRALERPMGPTAMLHELLAFAGERGLHTEAWHQAFRQHFGEGRNLWSVDDVVAFAVDLGLDPDEVRDVLRSGRYRAQVQRDQREAQELGAGGTPFIVIDGSLALPGARDIDGIVALLERAWAASHPVVVVDEGAMCLPDEGVCQPGLDATA